MAKAPGKVAGSLGNTKYYYTKDGKIVDEAGKPVSDRIAVLFEPGTASPEPKMEDVFPETFAGGKKQRKARSTVDADKESSEYKRNAQELRMTFENVEDLLRDNNVILKDQIVLQERSLVLLEEVVQAIKNKTGGSGGGFNFPKLPRITPLAGLIGSIVTGGMALSYASTKFAEGEGGTQLAEAMNTSDESGVNMLGAMSPDMAIGAYAMHPELNPVINKPATNVISSATNATSISPAGSTTNPTTTTKQSAAVAAAGAAKVQSKNTLTFKGDELKFIADKLTFDVQTLKIESKTAPQQQQQQIGAPSVGAPTRATTGTGGANALGAGPGSVQSGNVTTPGGVAAPDRSRNLGSPNFTGNTGAGTSGPSFGGIGAGQPLKLGKSSVNPQEMYSYLRSKGVDHEHAVGMLANVQGESNFNSSSIGDNGTSGGLFQHHASRFAAMKNAAGPDWNKNWKGQVDFALNEPETKKYLKRQVSSGQEAAAAFVVDFEKPKYPAEAIRTRSGMAGNFQNFTSDAATNPVAAAGTIPATAVVPAAATPTTKAPVGSGRGNGEAELSQRHADSVGAGRGNIVEKDGERAAATREWQKNSRGIEGQWVKNGRTTDFVTRESIEAKEQAKITEDQTRASYIAEAKSNVDAIRSPMENMVAKQEAMKPKVPAAAIGIGAGAFGAYAPTSMAINPGRGSVNEVAGERAKYQNASKNKSQKRLDHETPKTVSPGGDLMSSAANKHPYLPIAAAMGLLAAAVGVAAMRGHR